MGSESEVAKIADMILLDDNFCLIIGGVKVVGLSSITRKNHLLILYNQTF